MRSFAPPPDIAEDITARATELVVQHQDQIHTQTSRLFTILMFGQWVRELRLRCGSPPRLGWRDEPGASTCLAGSVSRWRYHELTRILDSDSAS